jgi:hypothetical protein
MVSLIGKPAQISFLSPEVTVHLELAPWEFQSALRRAKGKVTGGTASSGTVFVKTVDTCIDIVSTPGLVELPPNEPAASLIFASKGEGLRKLPKGGIADDTAPLDKRFTRISPDNRPAVCQIRPLSHGLDP